MSAARYTRVCSALRIGGSLWFSQGKDLAEAEPWVLPSETIRSRSPACLSFLGLWHPEPTPTQPSVFVVSFYLFNCKSNSYFLDSLKNTGRRKREDINAGH